MEGEEDEERWVTWPEEAVAVVVMVTAAALRRRRHRPATPVPRPLGAADTITLPGLASSCCHPEDRRKQHEKTNRTTEMDKDK